MVLYWLKFDATLDFCSAKKRRFGSYKCTFWFDPLSKLRTNDNVSLVTKGFSGFEPEPSGFPVTWLCSLPSGENLDLGDHTNPEDGVVLPVPGKE